MVLPAVDGIFGPVTEAAVRVFQTSTNDEGAVLMPVIAGERTWFALASAPGPTLDTAAGLT